MTTEFDIDASISITDIYNEEVLRNLIGLNLTFKNRVICATTANINVNTDLQVGDSIDGVTLSLGDRVLVKDQTTASENGLYIVSSTGLATRTGDLTVNSDASSIAVIVNQGTTNADQFWFCTTNEGDAVVGVDDLIFQELSGGGGGGSPGGVNTQIQWNNAGAFGGISSWTTNGTTQLNGDDSAFLNIGTGSDYQIQHTGTNTVIISQTGDLVTDNTNVNGSTIFRLGTDTSATDFQVQNNSTNALFTVDASGGISANSNVISDVDSPVLGTDAANKTYVDGLAGPGGSDTELQYNNSGSLDGVSTITTDGTNLNISGGNLTLADSDNLQIGTGGDLDIVHNGTNSIITSATGNLTIDNTATTGNTILQLGADSSATQLQILNNSGATIFDAYSGRCGVPDNVAFTVGTSTIDLVVLHNGTDSSIISTTGDLNIGNANTTGTTFASLGSNTSSSAFTVQNASSTTLFTVLGSGTVNVPDTSTFNVGSGNDLQLSHDGSNNFITSQTGDLIIDNTATTNSTIAQLGTDTNATDFQVQNNSGSALLTVSGNGAIILNKGTVTQATNINTGVTLNTAAGLITTQSASTASAGTDSFTVTNATCLATSGVLVQINTYSGTYATNGIPIVGVSSIAAGSFQIDIHNGGANALSGTFTIAFVVV